MRLKISSTISNEYMTRGVYDFIDQRGVYDLTDEQAHELLQDAIFNYLHTDAPRGVSNAYRALAHKLLNAGYSED